jgi:menaquinone-specific isochorismate synthase
VAVQGNELRSMALAGSIRRGQTPAEDAALAAELLASQKDRHEHQVVARALLRRLRSYSLSLESPDLPQILALSNIQHLHTPVRATLRHPGDILRLVSRLHPTPALSGDPNKSAQAFIRDHEPITRGWYAAPVGWVDAHMNGVFAVAIRSAVVQRERAWLYAGAGIVNASQPQTEWAETALKFRPMLQALGIPRHASLPALDIAEAVK